MLRVKKAQSILEYSILIAIVIAAVVVMQVYMKRGISGRLKESSDKISGGQSFSASNTTTYEHSGLVDGTGKPRQITEMTAIDANAAALAPIVNPNLTNVKDMSQQGAYSVSSSTGGSTNSISESATDSASNEAFKANGLQSTGVDNTDFQPGP